MVVVVVVVLWGRGFDVCGRGAPVGRTVVVVVVVVGVGIGWVLRVGRPSGGR